MNMKHGAECAYRKPNNKGVEGVMDMAKAKKPAVKKAVKKSTKKGY